MGFEYVALAQLNPNEVALIVALLQNDPRYQVLTTDGSTGLSIRFNRPPTQDSWPEDAHIYFDDKICVTFWGGPKEDWYPLLQEVETTLEKIGHRVRFEED